MHMRAGQRPGGALQRRAGLLIGVIAVIAGCAKPSLPALESVAALPAPQVPAWIAQIAPLGSAKTRSQIRVVFTSPVIPVEELGAATTQDVLSHFRIAPALPGEFVVLTPRMIGFQSSAEIPASTRIRITLTAGLHDLQGHRLDRDLAWTFSTPPLRFNLPEDASTPGTVALKPVIRVIANAKIDAATFSQHAAFTSGSAPTVPATAALESPDPDVGMPVYDVSPQSDLQRATAYRLAIDPGVMPAAGNLPSDKTFRVAMSTYSPLTFVSALPTADPMTSSGQPRFANGDPVLVFNNALDPKTYAQHVTVSPQVHSSGPLFSLTDDGTGILVNPYALAPRTAYTFAFDANLQDVYGQHLGKAAQTAYTTVNYAPYFWAPTGGNTFVASQNLQLQYSAINLPGNRYRAQYRVLTPDDLANVDASSPSQLLSAPGSWRTFPISAAQNAATTIAVPLREKLGAPAGALAYGALGLQSLGPSYGVVQLTNLGIFAQWFPQSGSVMVQHLSDGSPAAGASVDVYVSHIYESPAAAPMRCASGTTNAQGTLTISGLDVERCYTGDRPADQAPQLYVVARQGSDWSYVRTFDYSGVYTYGSAIGDATWSAGQPISRGTIYSDRQMYQPGERGWFTAICYVLQNGSLHADRNTRYTVTLRDPDGRETTLPPQTTNRFATFSFPVDFRKTQPLGYYTLVAKSPDGAQITGDFRLAEFRPPNFSVDLKLDREFAAAGDTVKASGNAHYLFGAPMSGTATVHVTRQPAYFTPKDWDDYAFGRQWFWPDQMPDVPADAGQQSVQLDAQGNAAAQVAVAPDLPYAMTYQVDLQATDVSHLASSATQSFTAFPSTTLIGLRSDFVATVNTPIKTAVVVTNPQGAAQQGISVHVELQKMSFSSVTQVVEGSESARNQVQYTTVDQTDVTSGAQPQSISLVAKDAGSYRIRANAAGASNDATATDTQVWVTGPGQAQWGAQNPSQLQLKLDKRTYAPGDGAMVAVASPYQKADLYLSVVRDRVLFSTLVHVDGSAPKVRIPISQAMFPNAAVEGVLVRRGPAISGPNAQGLDSLVRIGMIPLSIGLKNQYLTVKLAFAKDKLEPRTQQSVRLQLLDGDGKPVAGQFTVIAVNDAILQLTGYRPPDLVKVVLSDQPIATRFADNRPDVTLAQPSDIAQKGWGYGGGFLAGAAGTRVRTQFVPLAYFNGAVQTNADGSATVSFTVPDNLTTWRVMAVAATADARPRFGNADATFITTKPLVTDPLLPQFARPGDRFDAGLSLMNSTRAPVDARTQALLSGSLSFETPSGSQTQAQQQFRPGMNAWRFPMIVNGAGQASMQFTTTIGAAGSDAFRVPLEIRTSDVSESTMDAGSTQSEAEVSLTIGSNPGTVRVHMAASLLAQVEEPAKRALGADKLSLLTPIANRLHIAASLIALRGVLGFRSGGIDAAKEAADDIAQLIALQRIDGGFAFWPGGSSDAFGTADAVRALGYAKESGVAVDPAVLAKAKPYLVRTLGDPATVEKWCTSDSCKASLRIAMLQALAATGDRRTDFAQELYAQRNGLDISGRIDLALFLNQSPNWRVEADTLAMELAQEIYVTGRYANIQSQNVWSGSHVEAQAGYLQLLVLRNASTEDQDRALRALVAQQCKCRWPGLADTASALEAIVAYSREHRSPPDFTVQPLVDGRPQGTFRFAGFAAPDQTIALTSLTPGAHTIALRKTGAGTLHYLVTYDYRLGARAPGRYSGLRVTRTIRSANASSVVATIDMAPSAQPLSLEPGNVYDVGVQVVTDHPVDRVAISDPLPAGAEALDTSFQTTAAFYQPLATDWQIDYQQIYRDRIIAFAQHLDTGVYTFHYLVRTVTPGTYIWPGTSAHLLDAPEQFGRSAFIDVQVPSETR